MAVSGSGVVSGGNSGGSTSGAPAPKGGSSSITKSVDGGKGPKFGYEKAEEERAQKQETKNPSTLAKKEAPKENPPSKESRESKDSRETSKESAPKKDPTAAALEALTEEIHGKPKKDKEGADQESLSDEELAGLGDRARKRIEKLAGENKQFRENQQKMAQYVKGVNQQWNQKLSQVTQHFQGQLQESNANMSKMQGLLEGYMKRGGAAEEVDPVDSLGERLDPRFKSILEQEVGPLKQELQQLRQEKEEQLRQAKIRAGSRQANLETDQAVTEHILSGFDEAEAKALSNKMGTILLALSYGSNKPAKALAPALRSFMDRYAIGRLSAKSRELSKVHEEGKQAPPATNPGSGRGDAKGDVMPKTMEDIKKSDPKAKDHLDWMMKHSRPPGF